MCALKQGMGLVAKGCREEGEVVRDLIKNKNAIYRFLFKLAFCCTKVKFGIWDEESPIFIQFSSH